MINSIADGKETISAEDLEKLKSLYSTFVSDILGLKNENEGGNEGEKLTGVVDFLLNLRLEAKANKDFQTSDKIRDGLQSLGFVIKDKKDGFEWEIQ